MISKWSYGCFLFAGRFAFNRFMMSIVVIRAPVRSFEINSFMYYLTCVALVRTSDITSFSCCDS